ncbi:ECs_2282 family putative zinc-binding protein [Nitrobacter sp.]|uniref:ECs_2282 family putative zinc-binding protein n=1 Tax=Nitrobacter sp. TaxID=29420 RepID=UPI003F64E909
MTTENVSVNFKCPKCGCTSINLPDHHTDESHATCKDCGADFGPYGDIKKRAVELVRDKAQEKLRNAFKGVKGFKIT